MAGEENLEMAIHKMEAKMRDSQNLRTVMNGVNIEREKQATLAWK